MARTSYNQYRYRIGYNAYYYIGLFFKTGLIINSEVLSVFVTSPLDTVINIILSAALAFLLIYAPWRIAGKGT